MTTIIYRYTVDGETKYVGSTFTSEFKNTKYRHRRTLKSKKGIIADRIEFFVIEKCEDGVRFERESFHISDYSNQGSELWNIADPLKIHSKIRRGGHPSEETLRKLTGRTRSEESRKRISEAHKGIKYPSHSEQLKGKPFFAGRKHSEESRKKMSDAKIGNKINVGRKRPDLSERSKGNTIWKGRKHSESSRRKMSESMKGIPKPNLVETNKVLRSIQKECGCSRSEACQILRERRQSCR